jgi:hypothetical protein
LLFDKNERNSLHLINEFIKKAQRHDRKTKVQKK